MRSLNKLSVIGKVKSEPKLELTKGGLEIIRFTVATTDETKDKKESEELHNFVFFGKQASEISDVIKVGCVVYSEGKIKTSNFKDKKTTEVVGSFWQLICDGVNQRVGDLQEQYHRGSYARPVLVESEESVVPF